ncbi:uncharacterized protein LOC125179187 [Hyalella azteca]|uniref:Uncharacterized protein LOC125179187 n=1 Tax=Hyalella azteca TaxID=294128 RepID=A0A979FW21_HYAAZ|nr:uncharacterized protein LOC125179187 [Hyalella azteca]
MTGPVHTRHGAVQGVYKQISGAGRVASFLGIPYASPPVGSARFQHAKPPSNWAGVHRADKHGPACPQSEVADTHLTHDVAQQQSEDCLYVNIFSPEKAIHDRQPYPGSDVRKRRRRDGEQREPHADEQSAREERPTQSGQKHSPSPHPVRSTRYIGRKMPLASPATKDPVDERTKSVELIGEKSATISDVQRIFTDTLKEERLEQFIEKKAPLNIKVMPQMPANGTKHEVLGSAGKEFSRKKGDVYPAGAIYRDVKKPVPLGNELIEVSSTQGHVKRDGHSLDYRAKNRKTILKNNTNVWLKRDLGSIGLLDTSKINVSPSEYKFIVPRHEIKRCCTTNEVAKLESLRGRERKIESSEYRKRSGESVKINAFLSAPDKHDVFERLRDRAFRPGYGSRKFLGQDSHLWTSLPSYFRGKLCRVCHDTRSTISGSSTLVRTERQTDRKPLSQLTDSEKSFRHMNAPKPIAATSQTSGQNSVIGLLQLKEETSSVNATSPRATKQIIGLQQHKEAHETSSHNSRTSSPTREALTPTVGSQNKTNLYHDFSHNIHDPAMRSRRTSKTTPVIDSRNKTNMPHEFARTLYERGGGSLLRSRRTSKTTLVIDSRNTTNQPHESAHTTHEHGGESLLRSRRTSKKLLSVLVIVPGMSYSGGSAQRYDASALAALGHLVVVTFNYRLGTLGFLNAGVNMTSGRGANYGMTDQLAALRWVQDNIMAFGGNPRKVTLLGHGMSAACVHLLMAYTASTDKASHGNISVNKLHTDSRIT